MTREEFKQRVKQLEHEAKINPIGYQRKVMLLAWLGNAYVGSIIAVLLAILVAMVLLLPVLKALAVKLILGLLILLFFVLKALWIKLEAPQGREITAQEAPALFLMIESLRQRLNSVPFHHVMITDDFNAAVVQVPRLGIFGWPRNYLLIGLPLMKLMSKPQFKAVLAHEFGHLSQGHGKLANKIYCQRQRWSTLIQALEENERFGTFLFKPFFNWFAPYFAAYTFPMARSNEYEADAISAKLTSAATAAEALTSVNIFAQYLQEKFWPAITLPAADIPQPNIMPFVSMGQQIKQQIDVEDARHWLKDAMAQHTGLDDTHPALSERLAALKQRPRLAIPETDQAADQLLGNSLTNIITQFDQQWLHHIQDSWQQHYQQTQADRQTLRQLNLRVEHGELLMADEAYQRACLTHHVAADPGAATQQFEQLYQQDNKNARLCFSLGACYLEQDNPQGCQLIEQAMEMDQDGIAICSEILRDYYWRTGNQKLAEQWHQRWLEHNEWMEAAQAERSQISFQDNITAHNLPEASLRQLKQQLKQIPAIRKAYLICKETEYFPEIPCYVLGISLRGWFSFGRQVDEDEIYQQLEEKVNLPEDTLIIRLDKSGKKYMHLFRWKKKSRLI